MKTNTATLSFSHIPSVFIPISEHRVSHYPITQAVHGNSDRQFIFSHEIKCACSLCPLAESTNISYHTHIARDKKMYSWMKM
jgi:hypothetical protein